MRPVPDRFVDRLEADERFDRPGELLELLAKPLKQDARLTSLLAGTWIGHPLHPPLTDIPIGAFTSASILDWLSRRGSRRAPDLLVAVGLLASLPTAAAGLRDWTDTQGPTRRLGTAHALTNVTALVLYAWSLVKRTKTKGGAAAFLRLLGLTVLTVGGFLGGHLGYRRGVGVDENAFAPRIGEWSAAIADDELGLRTPRKVTVDGVDVLLYRDGDQVCAIANRCSHLGGPLDEGHVHEEEGVISCPWHHSSFEACSGQVVRGPTSHPQPAFDTRIRDGVIEVRSRA